VAADRETFFAPETLLTEVVTFLSATGGNREMPFERSRKSNLLPRLAIMASCLTVILILAYGVYAQQAQLKLTVTSAPITDASKPADVVLHVTHSNGTGIDQNTVTQFGSVKVGDASVSIKSTDVAGSNVTFTPPPNLTGIQKVQLLDKNNQALGETQLQYPPQSPSPTPTATPSAIETRQNNLSGSLWYTLSILVLFGFMLATFVILIYRVIKFSRSSFRTATGFPVGSFRTILAFILVALLAFYVLTSILSISEFSPPQSLLGIVATVIGFYFGSRSSEEGAVDPGVAGIVRGIVTAGPVPARGAVVKFRRDDGTEPYIRVTDVEGRFTPVSASARVLALRTRS